LTVCSKYGVETQHFTITKAIIEAAEELLLVEKEEVKKKWKP